MECLKLDELEILKRLQMILYNTLVFICKVKKGLLLVSKDCHINYGMIIIFILCFVEQEKFMMPHFIKVC